MRARPAFVAIAFLALFSSACAGAKKAYHKAFDDLGGASRLFNDYVRWGYNDKAGEFVESPTRDQFLHWREGLDKTLRFTDVHVGTANFPENASEATVPVTLTFYRNDSLTEQTASITEHWYLKDLHWYVRFEPWLK